jgi:hypothetical protein
MLGLIRKINLEGKNNHSIALNTKCIAYTIDEKSINLLEYNESNSHVFCLNIFF